jgi:cellulose synthase/poly-beta-1,6-N-acetylglucosamine synthase-like glycosyltransferase
MMQEALSHAGDAGGIVALAASLAYALVLLLLLPFGAHRLTVLWRRLRKPPLAVAERWIGELPRVTVQLPVYNEANVVGRLIDAAGSLDYPNDRLEIQLLDDSTDETTAIATARVATWRRRGRRIEHLRRGSRCGYKAGALAHGLRRARGDLLLVLDADFVPQPDLLRRLLPPFSDSDVGMVQAAWDYLNESDSWLTRAQALMLDAHFRIESEARFRSGLFFNFNGTAGMWRRACVEDSGGWRATTLTEDLDLSYRAQLAGWRFVFLGDVQVPSEVPADMRAVEIQQERWAQGGVQTARLVLPSIWRSSHRLAIKAEATAHLLGHIVHPVTLLLGAALSLLAFSGAGRDWLPAWLHLLGVSAATVPFVAFAALAGLQSGLRLRELPRRIVEALALGVGLGVPLTWAVARGARGGDTPFMRTPKKGERTVRRYRATLHVAPAAWRAVAGLSLGVAAVLLIGSGAAAPALLTGLFAAGYIATTWAALRGDRIDAQEGQERTMDRQADEERFGPASRRLVGVQPPVRHEDSAAEQQPGTAAA